MTLSARDDTTIARRHAAGDTIRELARAYAVGERAIRASLRRTQAPPSPGSTYRQDVDDQLILTMRADGETWAAIARRVGMTRRGVQLRHDAACRASGM